MDYNGNFPQFRNLTENEIECKPTNIQPGKGLSILLYKTARTDITILNETVGNLNWQCDYKEIKDNMYCGVSILNTESEQWITKWDCGTESAYGDTNKGEASDAFKRACFKWGIGIELYTAPFIWIPYDKCNIVNGKCNGKCFDNFIVEKIAIKNHTITGISIINNSMYGKRVFVWYKNPQKPPTPSNEYTESLAYDYAHCEDFGAHHFDIM